MLYVQANEATSNFDQLMNDEEYIKEQLEALEKLNASLASGKEVKDITL